MSKSAPFLTFGGITVKAGMRALRVAAISASRAVITVTSPPIQIASTPREIRAFAASTTPAELSTVDSIRLMPSSAQMARAAFTCASEFASAAFQTTPTVASAGFISRANLKASAIGCMVP
jgi:hypothetical protein